MAPLAFGRSAIFALSAVQGSAGNGLAIDRTPFTRLPVCQAVTRGPVILSIGGSVLAGEPLEPDGFSRLAAKLAERAADPLGLVVGGGASARRYIDAGRELGLDEAGLDHLGIQLTRANAWLLLAAFGENAYPQPATDFEEAALALRSYTRVCMGGTHPGHTTDAVAAMLSERVHAQRLVIVTNVDGVYSADPTEDPSAELLETVTPTELIHLSGTAREAGSKTIVDPLAAQVVRRSGIPLAVVGGDDLDNVADAVEGKAFKGTRVES